MTKDLVVAAFNNAGECVSHTYCRSGDEVEEVFEHYNRKSYRVNVYVRGEENWTMKSSNSGWREGEITLPLNFF